MSKKKTNDEVPKEHKRPWQETMATVEDIKAFLGDRIYLRHNCRSTTRRRGEAFRVPIRSSLYERERSMRGTAGRGFTEA